MSGLPKHDYIFNENNGNNKSHFVWKRPFVNIVLSILSRYNNLYLLTKATDTYAIDICNGIEISNYFIEKKFRNDIKSYNEKNNSKGKNLAIFDNINIKNSVLIDDLDSNHVDNQQFIHIRPYSFYKCYDIELLKLLLNISLLNVKHIFYK